MATNKTDFIDFANTNQGNPEAGFTRIYGANSRLGYTLGDGSGGYGLLAHVPHNPPQISPAAVDGSDLVAKFNQLLAACRAAGICG